LWRAHRWCWPPTSARDQQRQIGVSNGCNVPIIDAASRLARARRNNRNRRPHDQIDCISESVVVPARTSQYMSVRAQWIIQ
jgi:hypothetical protein